MNRGKYNKLFCTRAKVLIVNFLMRDLVGVSNGFLCGPHVWARGSPGPIGNKLQITNIFIII